jgi:hypothetical protein
MQRLTTLIICCFYLPALSQIGISTPLYKGKDADLIAPSWGGQIQVFIPVPFPVKIKDTTRAYLVFQPAMKWDWYNFKKNLVIERQNGFTSFAEDPDINHNYSTKAFTTTSMMQSSTFYMPVNLFLWTKKLKGVLFAPGAYAEYLVGGKFKRKFSDNGSPAYIKDKYKDNPDFFGFQRFQFGLCGHVSYKFITVYGLYSLTPLFKPGEGIDVYKYNIGIWVNFFWKRKYLKPY